MSASLLDPSLADLALMTDEEFAAWWRALVGEPPAILLQDRAEMARVLKETMMPLRSPPKLKVASSAVSPSGQPGATMAEVRSCPAQRQGRP